MKANVCVPSLQLLSDAVSVSSSSQSVCSTMSSFRDPLLASFEEELLVNYQKPALAKTQTSWSIKKGLMCSPRQGGRSNSLGANLNTSTVSQGEYSTNLGRSRSSGFRTPSIVSGGSRRHSEDSRRQITISISQDSDNSAVSFKSGMFPFASDVSSFADTLARRVLCESITATCRPTTETGESDRRHAVISTYSELLSRSIIDNVLELLEILNSDWLEQNKVVTWSDKLENAQQYSDTMSEPDIQMRRAQR